MSTNSLNIKIYRWLYGARCNNIYIYHPLTLESTVGTEYFFVKLFSVISVSSVVKKIFSCRIAELCSSRAFFCASCAFLWLYHSRPSDSTFSVFVVLEYVQDWHPVSNIQHLASRSSFSSWLIQKHPKIILLISPIAPDVRGQGLTERGDLFAVVTDQQRMLGEPGGIQHVENHRARRSLEHLSNHTGIEIRISTAVTQGAGGKDIIDLWQNDGREIGLKKISIGTVFKSFLCSRDKLWHLIYAGINKI